MGPPRRSGRDGRGGPSLADRPSRPITGPRAWPMLSSGPTRNPLRSPSRRWPSAPDSLLAPASADPSSDPAQPTRRGHAPPTSVTAAEEARAAELEAAILAEEKAAEAARRPASADAAPATESTAGVLLLVRPAGDAGRRGVRLRPARHPADRDRRRLPARHPRGPRRSCERDAPLHPLATDRRRRAASATRDPIAQATVRDLASTDERRGSA